MEWGKSKTKIPLKIKQTHSLALSPNLTFKTDHSSANSFFVSLKNAPSPPPWPAQVLAMSASKMVKYTRRASPKVGRRREERSSPPCPNNELVHHNKAPFPTRKAGDMEAFSSSG